MSLSGFSGFSGFSGHSGFSGFSGYSGGRGFSGYSGYSGIGTSGFSGYSGFDTTLRIGNTTGLALSFANNDHWNTSIDANASYTLTNIPTGRIVYARILNSHATNAVTITNPTASDWIIQNGLTTVTLLPGEQVKVSIFYDGTNYEMIYGETLKKNT